MSREITINLMPDTRTRCKNCKNRYFKESDRSFYCSVPEKSSVGAKEITTDMAICNRKCGSFIKKVPIDKQPKRVIVEFEVDTSKVGRSYFENRLEMDFKITDEYIKLKEIDGPDGWS